MNYQGILVGLGTFIIIGVLHPVVIKTEYYWGKGVWPVFLIGGLVSCGFSLFIKQTVLSILLAVLGFSLFWSIQELYEQENRVKKGWHPANPAKKNKGDSRK